MKQKKKMNLIWNRRNKMILNNQDMSDNKEHWGVRGLDKDQPYPTHNYNLKHDDGLQWMRDLDNGDLDSDSLTINEDIEN